MIPGLIGGGVAGAGLPVLKLAFSLVLVVVLILLLQKAARRWGGGLGNAGGDQIQLLSQRSLGPRLSLALVQVRGRVLLVGISPQGIRAVANLGEAAVEGARAASFGPAAVPGNPIGPKLPGLFSRLRLLRRAEPAVARPTTRGASPAPAPVPGAALASSAAPAPRARPASGVRGASQAHRRTSAPSAPGFEGELTRRLAALRDTYRPVSEWELTASEEGRP